MFGKFPSKFSQKQSRIFMGNNRQHPQNWFKECQHPSSCPLIWQESMREGSFPSIGEGKSISRTSAKVGRLDYHIFWMEGWHLVQNFIILFETFQRPKFLVDSFSPCALCSDIWLSNGPWKLLKGHFPAHRPLPVAQTEVPEHSLVLLVLLWASRIWVVTGGIGVIFRAEFSLLHFLGLRGQWGD